MHACIRSRSRNRSPTTHPRFLSIFPRTIPTTKNHKQRIHNKHITKNTNQKKKTATSKVGLFHYFADDHPHNVAQEDLDPNYDSMTVALLSLILGFGTAVFAIALRAIRFSSFCCNDYVRSVITDFA